MRSHIIGRVSIGTGKRLDLTTTQRTMSKCKYCDKTFTDERRPNSTQCPSCQVSKRRWSRKRECVDYLGGQCQRCGWDKHLAGLQFHHLRDKKFELNANGLLLKWKRLVVELQKCILLCACCHAIEGSNSGRFQKRITR